MPDLTELLYWGACWIAATVAMLTLAAWITNSAASWVGVVTFLAVALGIWLFGRVSLFLSRLKQTRRR